MDCQSHSMLISESLGLSQACVMKQWSTCKPQTWGLRTQVKHYGTCQGTWPSHFWSGVVMAAGIDKSVVSVGLKLRQGRWTLSLWTVNSEKHADVLISLSGRCRGKLCVLLTADRLVIYLLVSAVKFCLGLRFLGSLCQKRHFWK